MEYNETDNNVEQGILPSSSISNDESHKYHENINTITSLKCVDYYIILPGHPNFWLILIISKGKIVVKPIQDPDCLYCNCIGSRVRLRLIGLNPDSIKNVTSKVYPGKFYQEKYNWFI